ncbi:hypothetical protein DNTS_022975 [Danionella cerebrum]|uniref:Protein shisa-5 n=1 Tax=Danionella cerebrum TaxID=2873325 RepID=A0A553RHG0_9TELE|nr:hypothetical protein DNTS_022975 [Danionella translucida]
MASTAPALLLLFAGLFTTSTLADDDCISYITSSGSIAVGISVSLFVLFIIFIIICCVCPCCCIYKMCRKPRPVMGATTTTVVTTQYPQQPMVQGGQYPSYQPIPPPSGYSGTPGYGATPMPTGPYQGQPYAAGPPPPYQEAGNQAAYDGRQAAYPMQPPAQPGFTQPPPTDYSATQPAYNPAYNPAYVEPPKQGY